MRCPASKFITHTFSHMCFLVLLAAATFRLDEKTYPMSFNITTDLFPFHGKESYPEKVENLLKATFRPANVLMTNVQICLMFWVLGKSVRFSSEAPTVAKYGIVARFFANVNSQFLRRHLKISAGDQLIHERCLEPEGLSEIPSGSPSPDTKERRRKRSW